MKKYKAQFKRKGSAENEVGIASSFDESDIPARIKPVTAADRPESQSCNQTASSELYSNEDGPTIRRSHSLKT